MTSSPTSSAPGDTDHGRLRAISVFEVATVLVQRRFLVLAASLLSGAIAVYPTFTQTDTFTAVAVAMTSQPSNGRSASRLDALVGQFGGGSGEGGGGSASSPAALGALAKSNVILGRLMEDSVTVPGGARTRLGNFVAGAAEPEDTDRERAVRRDRAVKGLRGWVSVTGGGIPGSVEISVQTPWPEVSAEVASLLLNQLDRWNREQGQRSAGVERRFLEERLSEQSERLAQAEARMASFLEANRQLGNSPQLAFERDRLQREVSLHQQILVGLLQSREDVRLREVRDTPVLTVIEPPAPPLEADPRQVKRRLLLGLFAGVFVGSVIALLLTAVNRERIAEDPEIRRFVAVVTAAIVPRRFLSRLSGKR